ncbi:hypothetical protein GQ54DRAFT_307174 [Martensiomyces pterosporus]|nr:hypothetical protein GQ54DRAFT_307174 [Martensiomyces pterosporus]
MALLDEIPLDILLAVVKWLKQDNWDKPVFYYLLPVASISTSLRQLLLPLLYRDLVFEYRRARNDNTRHNASLARSAGCSEYAQRVALFADECTNRDAIVSAVRDDVEVGNEAKWPNLRSYACTHIHECWAAAGVFPCSDLIRKLDEELPKLRQTPPVVYEGSSSIIPPAYTPPSVSFLTQLTSIYLSCSTQCIDANRFPQLFAPTLVDLTLYDVNPENVWSIFYDGHENQTVVFARLKRLEIRFVNPLHWEQNSDLPLHLQGVTNETLTNRSVWTAGAASGKPGCQVPLFPVLRILRCINMAYNFRDFISRTQCHNSLVSLYVDSRYAHFDFDAELFKTLETVEFNTHFRYEGKDLTGSVDLYRSAFISLLGAKTNVQRIKFSSGVHNTLFQVPPDIGCANLRSLHLSVEVDLMPMLRLLSKLKHLVELKLDIDYDYTYNANDGQEDAAEDIDELQLPQADFPPVNSTLHRFMCRLCTPRVRGCYTASYAFELALHLPALENMVLGVDEEGDVVLIEAMLGKFIQQMSGSPYMNDGLLSARVFPYWHEEMALWERQSYWG